MAARSPQFLARSNGGPSRISELLGMAQPRAQQSWGSDDANWSGAPDPATNSWNTQSWGEDDSSQSWGGNDSYGQQVPASQGWSEPQPTSPAVQPRTWQTPAISKASLKAASPAARTTYGAGPLTGAGRQLGKASSWSQPSGDLSTWTVPKASSQTGLFLPRRPTTVKTEQKGDEEFLVEIDKTSGESLGVDVNKELVIGAINPGGLVDLWNQENIGGRQVLKGDQIIEVNGKREYSERKQEVLKKTVLAIMIRRKSTAKGSGKGFQGMGVSMPSAKPSAKAPPRPVLLMKKEEPAAAGDYEEVELEDTFTAGARPVQRPWNSQQDFLRSSPTSPPLPLPRARGQEQWGAAAPSPSFTARRQGQAQEPSWSGAGVEAQAPTQTETVPDLNTAAGRTGALRLPKGKGKGKGKFAAQPQPTEDDTASMIRSLGVGLLKPQARPAPRVPKLAAPEPARAKYASQAAPPKGAPAKSLAKQPAQKSLLGLQKGMVVLFDGGKRGVVEHLFPKLGECWLSHESTGEPIFLEGVRDFRAFNASELTHTEEWHKGFKRTEFISVPASVADAVRLELHGLKDQANPLGLDMVQDLEDPLSYQVLVGPGEPRWVGDVAKIVQTMVDSNMNSMGMPADLEEQETPQVQRPPQRPKRSTDKSEEVADAYRKGFEACLEAMQEQQSKGKGKGARRTQDEDETPALSSTKRPLRQEAPEQRSDDPWADAFEPAEDVSTPVPMFKKPQKQGNAATSDAGTSPADEPAPEAPAKSPEKKKAKTTVPPTTVPLTVRDWAENQKQFEHLEKLPEGWIRILSSSGRMYHFHISTGASQFDVPQETPRAPLVVHLPPAAPSLETLAEGLPQGWTVQRSRSSSTIYYWNEAMQRSTLDRPQA